MTPYYQDERVTIYHGDCREILPLLDLADIGLVVTDPPYPDYHTEIYAQCDIGWLDTIPCQQYVFWSARAPFPLDYTAIHIWDKRVGIGCQYERVFERNGGTSYRVLRHSLINSPTTAKFVNDVFTGHPSQKPVVLIRELISPLHGANSVLLDPFMGSGSIIRAAKDLGHRAIGIEIEERYCEIAAKRLQQSVLALELA